MTSSLLHHGAPCRGLHIRCLPASVPKAAPRRTSALAALDAAALGSAHAVEAMSQVHSELLKSRALEQAQHGLLAALLDWLCSGAGG